MTRGTTLAQIVSKYRAEAGRSMEVNVGVGDLEAQKNLIRRTQDVLYEGFDWSFLRVDVHKDLYAGQRFYDVPIDLNFDRIEKIHVWYNNYPQEVTRGIRPEQYSIHDSRNDERGDPVLRWDIRWTDGAEQIEVWPIPETNGMTLEFTGIRKLRPLVSDADVADLDDNLIALFAAAETLERQKSADSKPVQAKAISLYNALKGRSQTGSRPLIFGQGKTEVVRERLTVKYP